MKNRDIKLVVFDIAGTTVKDENFVHHALINAMSKFGYPISIEEANAVMGYPKPFAISELLKKHDSLNDNNTSILVQDIHSVFVEDMIDFYSNSPEVVSVNNAEETFFQLKKIGVKVALDTGFSNEITEVIVQRLQWIKNGLIDAFISSDEVEDGRPQPHMIHALMNTLGVESTDEVAKVGDTISDLLEGNNAGCKYVIGITTGAYKREQLEQIKHTHLIDNLLEVVNIVSQ